MIQVEFINEGMSTPFSAAALKRLRAIAEHHMATIGCVNSGSGATASFAINWCEKNLRSYIVRSLVDEGKRIVYYVSCRPEDIDP